MLDPWLIAELERVARRSGRPTAHVIREAMERYVAEQRPAAEDRLPAFVGIGQGPGGVAERDEEILRRELPAGQTAEREAQP